MRKKFATGIIGLALIATPVFVSAQGIPMIPPNPTIEQLREIVLQLTELLAQLLGDRAGRPSCTIAPEKMSYRLGEMVTFTWTSRNATHVKFLPDTSGRDNLKVPEGTFETSGTQHIAADVLGNPFVVLAVVSANGRSAECRATINVRAVNDVSTHITVTSPNGGEQLVFGQQIPILWRQSGVTNVSVALYKNNQWYKWLMRGNDFSNTTEGRLDWNLSSTEIESGDVGRRIFTIYIIGDDARSSGYRDDYSDAPFSFVSGSDSTVFGASPQFGQAPLTVTFSGTVPNGRYLINFGDGSSPFMLGCVTEVCPMHNLPIEINTAHTYTAPGTYTAKLSSYTGSSQAPVEHAVIARAVITVSGGPEAISPLPTATYTGYLDEVLFITTHDMFEADALAHCQRHAANNPTKSIRCTWGEKTIYNVVVSTAAPTCSVAASPLTISPGQRLDVSWAGTAGVTRTYKLSRNGVTYFASGNIAASGTVSADYTELGGPGTIVRTDTVTNSAGSGTCTTSVTVVVHDRIASPNALTAGQNLTSPSGTFRAYYQPDGHFVIYRSDNSVAWSTGKYGYAPGKAVMQADGNFVNYDASGNAYWASNTAGRGTAPYALVLQDDGNLVIYDANGSVIWSAAHGIAMTPVQTNTNLANSLSALQSALRVLSSLFSR